MKHKLLKNFIVFSFIFISACGTKEDPNLNIIKNQLSQTSGVTNVTYSGQYAQGGRGTNVCGLIISTTLSAETQVKAQAKALEQQYNTDYRLCVNSYSPN